MRVRAIATMLGALLLVAAVTAAPGVNDANVLAVQGRSNATPSIAAAGRFVAVAWGASRSGSATGIYVATSRDGGHAFSTAVRVSGAEAQVSVSGEQPPRVVLIPGKGVDPSVVVVWTEKQASGTRLVTAQSDDGGATFSRGRVVAGADAPGNRGWEAVTTTRNGRVLALWLDHRELATGGNTPMSHEAHMKMAAADGTERAQLSKLYVGDVSGGTAREIASGVCYCCKTSFVTGADGSLYAVWRHVYPGNVRDIAFTVSRDDGRTFVPPVRVSEDKWSINGCPENGPALAVSGRDVHVLWPTLVNAAGAAEPGLALFHAVTRDGKSFTPRQLVPANGTPRHPQLAALAGGAVVAVWDEAAAGRRRVVLARGTAAVGKPLTFERTLLGDGPRDEYPVVAAVPDGAVVAWVSGPTDGSMIRVRRVAP